ncbi:type I 3-dehydroquinate dehydratase [Georgenia alba]|uniref:3-dehydroquinate dehydratase n=1 Tax=Georgenia alba TaxID=2233858 RepID=A0ABW2Q721_9MICO
MSSTRPVTVKELVLGPPPASPAVIVPVLGRTTAEVRGQVAGVAGLPVDLLEWRVDHLADLRDVVADLAAVRADVDRLTGRPLLATVRTAVEGGAAELTDTEYGTVISALARSGAADLLDVEHGRASAGEAIAAARASGLPVVLSAHDVVGTPSAEAMTDLLRAMRAAGGDVVKLAVTPHRTADVVALLEATATFAAEPGPPAITMAMGRLGVVTRLVGHLFGSVATFATAGRASAPGQPDLADLRAVLDAVARVTGPAGG